MKHTILTSASASWPPNSLISCPEGLSQLSNWTVIASPNNPAQLRSRPLHVPSGDVTGAGEISFCTLQRTREGHSMLPTKGSVTVKNWPIWGLTTAT